MTDLGYMIWFLGMAAFTITVLAVGTLAAAGLMPRRTPSSSSSDSSPDEPEPGVGTRREESSWTR